VELLDLALQFCLREERIHGNPIGSLNIEQLERNVQAAKATIADETLASFRAAAL
jgi:aryl-alcohol dehydrogenase-like predicted oxidoreductase